MADESNLHERLAKQAAALEAERQQRSQVENQLRAKDDLLHLWIENVKDYAIVSLDPHGQVIGWNQGAARILGYRAEEIIGQSFSRFFAPELIQAGKPERELQKAATTGRAEDENWVIRKDGSRFWASGITTACPGEGSNLRGFVKIFRDLTAQKQLQDALEEREQALAEQDRLKDQWLAMLGHELRNPLAAIATATEALEEIGEQDARASRLRALVARQAQHLSRLVDDLLDVSRIKQGKIQLYLQRVDLASVITRAVEANRTIFQARSHHLEMALPPGPLYLQADPVRLEQIISNLLHNAAKYTNPGGHIWLTAAQEGNHVVLRVRDTGIGIAPESLPNLFDPFIQLDTSLDRAQGGLGLGLNLVQNLTKMHGGHVEAHSAGPQQGSEFVVRLPALSPTAGAASEAEGAAEAPADRLPHVLLVEDDVDVAESLTALLRLWGHEVSVAHDGPTGLDLAQAVPPDAVILDVGLPGLNGYQVARRFRQQPQFRDTLLVALSGYGQPEDRLAAQEAGFNYHLIKPIKPKELKQILQQAGRSPKP